MKGLFNQTSLYYVEFPSKIRLNSAKFDIFWTFFGLFEGLCFSLECLLPYGKGKDNKGESRRRRSGSGSRSRSKSKSKSKSKTKTKILTIVRVRAVIPATCQQRM